MRTYEDIRKICPDFVVRYRLYSLSEGGRKITFQHLRCDFMYEGDDPFKDSIYMIHPQFLDEEGNALSVERAVPLEGKASMWILDPEMRATIHRKRAKIDTKGYFMEGSRKVGEVIIEEIIGLHESPMV